MCRVFLNDRLDELEKLKNTFTVIEANQKCAVCGELLSNEEMSVIGDKIEMTSQTYRNSDYTVFIRIGSTGGNQASAQDAIKVYGQWNGTNLTK